MCHAETEPGTEVAKGTSYEIEIDLSGGGMPALLAEPEGVRGSLLLVTDNFGRTMTERNVALDHTIYLGLGHGVMAASELTPYEPTYRDVSEAWSRTVEFFGSEMSG